MTKPIEWTTKRPAEVTQRRGLIVEVREEQDQPRPGGWRIVGQERATPADLIAALAAMPAEERGKVLREFDAGTGDVFEQLAMVRDQRNAETKRAETAERERDEARAELSRLREQKPPGYSYTDAVALFRRDPSASWTCDELQRVYGPDASCRFVEYEHRVQFTGASGYYSGPYTPTRADAKSTTWRRVDAKPDAHQPPRSHPLAEGSRWEGNTLVTSGGVRMRIRENVTHCRGPSLDVELLCRERYWLPLSDVLALAAKRGLL